MPTPSTAMNTSGKNIPKIFGTLEKYSKYCVSNAVFGILPKPAHDTLSKPRKQYCVCTHFLTSRFLPYWAHISSTCCWILRTWTVLRTPNRSSRRSLDPKYCTWTRILHYFWIWSRFITVKINTLFIVRAGSMDVGNKR